MRVSTPRCLCHISEVPLQLRFNKFVHRGYRCGLDARACATSVVQWHNESINIWTHAAACCVALYLLFVPYTPPGSHWMHGALRALAAVPCCASYALSLCYHTGMAHASCTLGPGSAGRYERLLCADVAGVVLVLAMPMATTVWYAFVARPALRIALCVLLACSTLYGTKAITTTDQTKRVVPLSAIILVRMFIIVLRLAGLATPCWRAMRLYVSLELVVAAGGIANGLFFPERHFPGRLDYGLNRHARALTPPARDALLGRQRAAVEALTHAPRFLSATKSCTSPPRQRCAASASRCVKNTSATPASWAWACDCSRAHVCN